MNTTTPRTLRPASADQEKALAAAPEVADKPAQKDVAAFAEELADAFSTDRYRNGWASSVRALRGAGYSDREVEAIIRSKWSRWAADKAQSPAKPYGRISGADLLAFLGEGPTGSANMRRDLARLVAETFPGEA